jgi:hypothetical protein
VSAAASHRDRFSEALNAAAASEALYQLALELKAEGMGQVAMYHLFAEFQQMIDGDDPRYDAIVDNMELAHGPPQIKGHAVFEHELTDADVRPPPLG